MRVTFDSNVWRIISSPNKFNNEDIAPLKFPMPSVEEQEAIAAVIDEAEEITAENAINYKTSSAPYFTN